MNFKKFILIVIVIIFFYIIYKLLTQQASTTNITNAENKVTISASALNTTNTSSVNYAMSIWFYVQNWDYNYGKMKPLLSRGLNYSDGSFNTACPSSCNQLLGCCANGSVPTSNQCSSGPVFSSCEEFSFFQLLSDMSSNPQSAPPSPLILLGESLNNIYILQSVVKSPNNSEHVNTVTNWLIQTPNFFEFDIYISVLENFPIQRWNNLIISFYGRSLDIYLEGKLVKTSLLPNVVYSNNNTSDVVITPNGGFNGFTSKFQYFANPLNPQQAWNIYKKGYTNSVFGGLLSKYKIQFSLLDGNTVEKSFEI